MATVWGAAQFIASKTGKTGLTVTVDIHEVQAGLGTITLVVNAGATTEIGNGMYAAEYASATVGRRYLATFKTADATVDQQHVACWMTEVADVGRIPTGGIATTTFSAGAIDAAAINAGAITSAKFASGAITADAIASAAITAAKIAAAAITSAKFDAGAIASGVIAQNAYLTMADRVWDELTAGHTGAGSFGKLLGETGVTLADDAITEDKLETTAVALLGAAAAGYVWDALIASYTVSGSFGERLNALATLAATVDAMWAGLESLSTDSPAGPASTIREMWIQTWRRMFKKAVLTATTLTTYADDGSTPVTTQAVADDGTSQTLGAAS